MRFFLLLLAVAYAICPYDLFPDFFIGPGWIDDLVLFGLLWWYFYSHRRKKFSYGKNYERTQEFSSERTPKGKKDPYSVLGVSREASPEEIKEAYRRLANQYHPDKVFHMGEEFRELAEVRFKEIQNAYQELTAR